MSDLDQAVHTTQSNGSVDPSAPPAAPTKKRIAHARFDGAIGRVEFSDVYKGAVVEIDFAAIPDTIKSIVGAYGAVQIIQTAYNSSDDPVGAAKAMVKRLLVGDWKPGLPRRDAEPDPLTQALADHLDKDPAFVEEVYIPAYMQKHGLDSAGMARRRLRAHPIIAHKIATITARRAAKIAADVRKAPSEDLSI